MGECGISDTGGNEIRSYWYLFAAVLLVLLGLGVLLFSAARSNSTNTITLVAAGDILLDRGVRVQLEQHGYDYPYARVKDILQKADIAFANLESPLVAGGTPVFKDRTLLFRGDPENAVALREAGFTILSLANNHTMDYGSAGLSSTLDVLGSSGIHSLGGGMDAEEARQPVYITTKGGVIGFLGYSVFPPEGYISFPHREEIARVDLQLMPEEIAEAKKNCDFLVLSFHWGREYDFFPSEQQKELAYLAVDYGADLVLGHHPHVLQGIEEYRGRLIFYSLGNFVFDRQIQSGTAETIILELTISSGEWKEASLIPVKIADCQPRPAEGKEGEEILLRLQKYSQGFGTSIIIQEGKGYLLYEPISEELSITIEKNLEIIMSSPKTSSNPQDYINAHQYEYENILKLGDEALNYLLLQFGNGQAPFAESKGKGVRANADLRGHIMMQLCKDILGDRNNVTDEMLSPEAWFSQLSIYEETKLPDFVYDGDDPILKLVYGTEIEKNINPYRGGFIVVAPKIHAYYEEGSKLKVFVTTYYANYHLYDKVVSLDGAGVVPAAITYVKNENGNYFLEEYKQAMDGSYFAKSIEDYCTMPVSGKKIAGLADKILGHYGNYNDITNLHRENLIRHLKANDQTGIKLKSRVGEIIPLT